MPVLDFGKYDKVSFVKMKHNFIKYLIHADKTIKGPFVQILRLTRNLCNPNLIVLKWRKDELPPTKCVCISPAGLPLWRRCTGKHTIAL